MHDDCRDARELMQNSAVRSSDSNIKETKNNMTQCRRMPVDRLMQVIMAYSQFLGTVR